jgi:cupin domain
MGAIKDPSHLLDVERQTYYASRPGFRIAEFTINPTQKIPWHCHSNVQDTFYVIEGRLQIFLRNPNEEVRLAPGETFRFGRSARTSLPTAVRPRRLSWFCKVSANTISSRSRRRVLFAVDAPQLLGRARDDFPPQLNQYRSLDRFESSTRCDWPAGRQMNPV